VPATMRPTSRASQRIDGEVLDESALVARVRAGDERALEVLFEVFAPELTRFVARLVRSRDVAEEVVQDLFFALWEGRESLVVRESVRSYLYRAARNRAFNVGRRRAIETRWEAQQVQSHDRPTAPAADALTGYNDTVAAIQRAVDRLPDRWRQVYLLSRQEGLRASEIAEVLGMSPKAVDQQLWRALTRLRAMLATHLPVGLGALHLTLVWVRFFGGRPV
jgi:RNA polymerase sigma-70 factor (ECF subfamily)